MTNEPLHLARTACVRPHHDDPSTFEITWGEGSRRQSFVTESAALAAALAVAPAETTVTDEVARLTDILDLLPADAARLVAGLRDHGLFRGDPDSLSAVEERWIDASWSDALDLHLATYDSEWCHDYSGDPEVMTRYFVDRNVQPDTDPPARYPVPDGETVALPASKALPDQFDVVQVKRRTSRSFHKTSLDLADVATILDWTFTPRPEVDVPNAYATQTYSVGAPFVVFTLFAGDSAPEQTRRDFAVYQHDPVGRRLVYRTSAKISSWSDLLWSQDYADGAPMLMLVCIDWAQYSWKYRATRGYRFALMECGAFMQTALMAATGLGIRTFQTPAINDSGFSRLLGVDDAELGPIYMAAFGRPAYRRVDR